MAIVQHFSKYLFTILPLTWPRCHMTIWPLAWPRWYSAKTFPKQRNSVPFQRKILFKVRIGLFWNELRQMSSSSGVNVAEGEIKKRQCPQLTFRPYWHFSFYISIKCKTLWLEKKRNKKKAFFSGLRSFIKLWTVFCIQWGESFLHKSIAWGSLCWLGTLSF